LARLVLKERTPVETVEMEEVLLLREREVLLQRRVDPAARELRQVLVMVRVEREALLHYAPVLSKLQEEMVRMDILLTMVVVVAAALEGVLALQMLVETLPRVRTILLV
jgi:hypothetical protein